MKIAIDAGHGSNTAGKRTPPLPETLEVNGEVVQAGEQFREHYANVGVCVRLEAALKRCGFETLPVSWDDADGRDDDNVALAERQKMIKAAACGISVSVHFNAVGDGTEFNDAAGVMTYIHSDTKKVKDSKALAEKVQGLLAGGTGQRNRGVAEAELAMCNCTALGTKAAVLVELAFMTNLHEAVTMMANPDFWTECAEEICRGVCDYTGIKYKLTDEEDEDMPRYKTLSEIPEQFRPVIDKLMNAKIINGDGSDPEGNNDVIDLSLDMVRGIVFNYRGGSYDRGLRAAGLEPAIRG
jgi:N-acetylmuramoyl-L-alanine amidase